MKIINFYDTVHFAIRGHNLGGIFYESFRVKKRKLRRDVSIKLWENSIRLQDVTFKNHLQYQLLVGDKSGMSQTGIFEEKSVLGNIFPGDPCKFIYVHALVFEGAETYRFKLKILFDEKRKGTSREAVRYCLTSEKTRVFN